MKETVKNVIKLVRVKHWIKNSFVFLPAFFASQAELILSPQLILLFFSFSFAASAIYVLNDWVDRDKDKAHPTKCKRPLASGFFGKKQAVIIFLTVLSLFISTLLLLQSGATYVLGYFVMNIAYSFKLKQISIVDVSIISTGFVLRALAGGAEVDIPISHWMVIMVFLLTISMAFAKRRDDLVLALNQNNTRKSLEGYNLQFLDMSIVMAFSITMISYVMYSISSEITERLGSERVYLTSIFVFLGIMRYLQLTIVFEKSGSPVDILWRDRFVQLVIILWMVSFGLLIYGKSI